jgi:hypothetical protein
VPQKEGPDRQSLIVDPEGVIAKTLGKRTESAFSRKTPSTFLGIFAQETSHIPSSSMHIVPEYQQPHLLLPVVTP